MYRPQTPKKTEHQGSLIVFKNKDERTGKDEVNKDNYADSDDKNEDMYINAQYNQVFNHNVIDTKSENQGIDNVAAGENDEALHLELIYMEWT